jgi:hypothetical protein
VQWLFYKQRVIIFKLSYYVTGMQDLCQQLEAHVLTIEKLHAESQGTPARHDKVSYMP